MNNKIKPYSVLSLDLGTTTGYAIYAPIRGKITQTGILNNEAKSTQSTGFKYIKFRGNLQELSDICAHSGEPIEIVCFEDVARHTATKAAQMYGGFRAIMESFCIDNRIEYGGYGVSEIKKHATGKGNAGKPLMVEMARKKWHIPAKYPNLHSNQKGFDDVADALWILDLARTRLQI